MTPWVKRLAIGTYCFVMGAFLLGGLQDSESMGIGILMAALGGTWAYVGTVKMHRGIGWIFEAIGKILGSAVAVVVAILTAILSIGVSLVAIYALVRFIKWAWMND